jgi:AcrR family transcriptional regulator
MAPRAYNLGLRLAAAEQTRTRIINAARDILSDDEFTGFSIDAIARRAGVARMTVYYQFASRHGLLEAIYDDLAARGLTENLSLVYATPDAFKELDRLIEVFCHFWSTDRLIIRRLRGLIVIDPEIATGIRAREVRRQDHITALLRRISDEHGWRATISVEEASTLIASMSSFETYDAIAPEQDDPAATASLLQQAIAAILGAPDIH